MFTTNLLLILVALIFSVIIAAFTYLYKNKNTSFSKYYLFFLRFASLFLLLLLLINPKWKQKEVTIIKPNLVVLTDNSKSIKDTKIVNEILQKIKSNKKIKHKFKLQHFNFSEDISNADTLSFTKNQTNIYKSLTSASKLFKNEIAPVILISDGNQTKGIDYKIFRGVQTIYPIIIGDTTKFQDVRIENLNANKYAFLKQKFPVEAFVVYDGNNNNFDVKFTVKESGKLIYSKNIQLSKTKNAVKLSFHLPTISVGKHYYTAAVSYLKNEKNTLNNTRNFAVEVIDEQSKIALVADILHPDIGMLKRSIESNKQRKLVVKKPTDKINLHKYQMLILYQPNTKFGTIFKNISKQKKNFLIVTGTQTDWNFLNANQHYFKKEIIHKTEDYNPKFNPSYTSFLIKDLDFSNFAPLTDFFGDVTFSINYESLLFQQVNNFSSDKPLLATFEENEVRGAVILGENSWRWRMSSKKATRDFIDFDIFISKLMQYLSSTKRSKLLEVTNKPSFLANESVKINAQLFNANFEFNPNASLWITLQNKSAKKTIKYPFALLNNTYEVNLTNLKPGNYSYVVSADNSKQKAKGSFVVSSFNMEQQFVGANKAALEHLALNNNGAVFYSNTISNLAEKIITNPNYRTIQKYKEIKTPLIDWKYVLGFIIFFLSLEWFIRKYKGYI